MTRGWGTQRRRDAGGDVESPLHGMRGGAVEEGADGFGVFVADRVAGDQLNLLGAADADAELHGARDLLLLEDGSALTSGGVPK